MFDKLFRKKPPKPPERPMGKWDFYFSRINDVLSSIFVDLGVIERAPIPGKSWIVFVEVTFNSPREDGLSSDEEAPKLLEIEDALLPVITAAVEGLYVGRITGGGCRQFYFYAAREEGMQSVIDQMKTAFKGYRFSGGSDEDPEWRHYKTLLYPSPRDMQRISNRHVLEQLEKHGDQHELPRAVDHMMYFRSLDGRNLCKSDLVADNYVIVGETSDTEGDRTMPYSLEFNRVDSVAWDTINEITLGLTNLAEKHGGTYDGWGCETTTG